MEAAERANFKLINGQHHVLLSTDKETLIIRNDYARHT